MAFSWKFFQGSQRSCLRLRNPATIFQANKIQVLPASTKSMGIRENPKRPRKRRILCQAILTRQTDSMSPFNKTTSQESSFCYCCECDDENHTVPQEIIKDATGVANSIQIPPPDSTKCIRRVSTRLRRTAWKI